MTRLRMVFQDRPAPGWAVATPYLSVSAMRQHGVYTYPNAKLLRLSGEQNHRCCHCGGEMLLVAGEPYLQLAATIEHIVPRSRGGTNAWVNLAAAHRRCNELRGNGDWDVLGCQAPRLIPKAWQR